MFKSRYGPWALIIGGSEGIGRALGEKLAQRGINVAITARKRSALDKATRLIRAAGNVEVRSLSQDMTAPEMMERVMAFTKDIEVGLLIYNAGAMDRITTFLGDNIEGHLHTIRLNCESPTRIAYHFASLMRERRRGGIVLMSSGAALAGAYGIPVYAATKAFDMILAEGLWYELKDYGINVLTPVIGQVRTEATERLFGPTPDAEKPEDTAQEILDNLENGPTLFAKSIEMIVPIARDKDRRKAVTEFCDVSKAVYGDMGSKATPFDPTAVVR